MGPETSMEVQAALRLGHRARVRRVHAVPRRPRLHRALDRAHPPLAGPLPRLARRARTGGPARLRDRPGRRRRGPAPRLRAGGRRARGARRDRDRRLARRGQGADVRGRRVDDRGAAGRSKPRHLLGIGEIDDLVRGVELGIDTFDCAMPTRIGRHGMAVVPDPDEALARRPGQGALEGGRRADPARAARCPACAARLLPRLPPLPVQGARADRACACSRSTTSPTCSA